MKKISYFIIMCIGLFGMPACNDLVGKEKLFGNAGGEGLLSK